MKITFNLETKNFDSEILTIIKDEDGVSQIHDWLEEDGSNGDLKLLYRSSRDGLSNKQFHSKCDYCGPAVSIIETNDGYILGGYSNTTWKNLGGWSCSKANKAFLFVLSGGVSAPCKMKLKNVNSMADGSYTANSPVIGTPGLRLDLHVHGSTVF